MGEFQGPAKQKPGRLRGLANQEGRGGRDAILESEHLHWRDQRMWSESHESVLTNRCVDCAHRSGCAIGGDPILLAIEIELQGTSEIVHHCAHALNRPGS